MRVFSTVMKVVAAAAAVVGAVYVAATYGDQIVAWAKKALSSLSKCPCCCGDAEATENAEQAPAAEEPPVEEAAPAAEEVQDVPEEPAPEVVVSEHEPVAEDKDFAE